MGFAVIGPNSGEGFFNKTNHKTRGRTRAMPIAKPVCVAHWRAEIRRFNCTFCNLPSHCLISSYKNVILQKGKINISSAKTTDALFSKDWSVVSSGRAIILGRELWLLQPQWKIKSCGTFLEFHTLTEPIITNTYANLPTGPKDNGISDSTRVMFHCGKCKTPLSSPLASDDSPLMHLLSIIT